MSRVVTPEMFWSRVEVRGPDECWPYVGPGCVTTSGHIRINFGGKKEYAHRVAYVLTYGTWPLLACHRCDRPTCVNASSHIYSGTAQQNVADRDARARRTPRLPRRPAHWSSRLTQRDLDELAEAKMLSVRVAVLALEYGVSASTIRSVWRTADDRQAA